MAAGVIPVICADMTTRRELLPPDLFPEYSSVEPEPASVARFIARFASDPAAMAEMKERLHTHYQKEWAHRLTGRAVAAPEALSFGLVNRLAESGSLLGLAEKLALEIANFPQLCMRNDHRSAFDQWGMDEAAAIKWKLCG